jgi:hypothetical protein
MAKIIRAKQRIFGDGVVANYNHAVFGSLKADAIAYSKDPDTIQSTAWDEGWKAATVNNQAPALQDLNAVDYLTTRQIAYILQAGVPEYDATTTHYIDDICRSGGSLHRSIVDDNTGNAVTDTSKWGGVFGINPLGSIIAMGNVAAWALPTADEVKDGYALCNGNTFAALGAGNYNASFTGNRPTLNDSRFLMGSTAVASTGGQNSTTLAAANIPQVSTSYTPAGTNAASSVSGSVGGSDGTHTHTATTTALGPINATQLVNAGSFAGAVTSIAAGSVTVTSTNSGHGHGFSLTAAAQGFTGQAATITVGNASPTALENRPLYFSVVYLMRVK